LPRPRKGSAGLPALSPGQAQYILERLVDDRRVSAGEVNRYVSDMHREINQLEQRLQSLRSAAGSAAQPVRRGPGRPPGSGAQRSTATAAGATTGGKRRRRRSAALTPEQRASRQLQGRYLGLIRQIPATRRAQYAKTAKEKGREAAIKDMQMALNKK
jgi:hypothetical protein